MYHLTNAIRRHLLTVVAVVSTFAWFSARSTDPPARPGTGAVHEARYLGIGGIEQWITVDGGSTNNPVMLFLHGGPGSTLTPFADALFGSWKTNVTLVHWDQRGAGRTFGRNGPDELTKEFILAHPLTLDRMAEDGIELATHLKSRFGDRKLILFGSSWGSLLAVEMLSREPDLFAAYIGHSQIVHPAADLPVSYQTVLRLAEDANDVESAEQLNRIGPPPYATARELGLMLRVVKKYEALNSAPMPAPWREWAAPYNNDTDRRNRFLGDDYSFIHYAGHRPLGIEPMYAGFNALELASKISVPVFIVQGENDILTSRSSTERFFEALDVPDGGYRVVPGAAHDFDEDVLVAIRDILIARVLPLLVDDRE